MLNLRNYVLFHHNSISPTFNSSHIFETLLFLKLNPLRCQPTF